MALEGDLSVFRLPDILQVIAQQRKTGILTIQGKSDILAVSFLDGEIVAADALNQSFEELLGEVLSGRGVVRPADFSKLAEEQRTSGERFVDFLVNRGALSREQLLESLRDLTYRLLLDVLRWREGQFKFYGGEEVAYEEGIRPLRVADVLMKALRDLAGEPGREGWMPHGFLAYAKIGDARPSRLIPEGFDETTPLDPSVAWITADEAELLEHLDGRTHAETLARSLGLGETRTYYALFRLLQAGLVRPIGEEEEWAEGPRAAVSSPTDSGRRVRPEALRMDRDAVEAADAALPRTGAGRWTRWIPGACALLALAIVAGTMLSPGSLLLAAPGLGHQRESLERLRRLSRFAHVDRAARTFHLLEGTYPSVLEELVTRGLLPERDTYDPRGAPLAYRATEEEYEIQPIEAGRNEPERGLKEGVFGDFLLDRSMFAGLNKNTGAPIVLID